MLKKALRIIEYVLIALSLIGLLFKSLHWPGGSIFIIFGLGILSVFYFALGWAHLNKIRLRRIFKKASYNKINALQIVGKFGFGWALSTLTISLVFKLMLWPGGQVQLIAGLIMVGTGLFISLISYLLKKHPHNIGLFIRGAAFGVIGLFLVSMTEMDLVRLEYKDYPDYIKAYETYTQNRTQENYLRVEFEGRKIHGEFDPDTEYDPSLMNY